MLEPLRQFICDACGELIAAPEEGWFQWDANFDGSEGSNIQIVHLESASPSMGARASFRCPAPNKVPSYHLEDVLPLALPRLFSHFDQGSDFENAYAAPQFTDMANFVQTFRRLTIPHYEEARLFWSKAIDEGVFEGHDQISAYSPDVLLSIIRRFSTY